MKSKWDIFTYISIIMIIAGVGLLIFYFLESRINECTSDPLKYAIEKIEAAYPNEQVIVIVTVAGRAFSFEEGIVNIEENIYSQPTNYNISK